MGMLLRAFLATGSACANEVELIKKVYAATGMKLKASSPKVGEIAAQSLPESPIAVRQVLLQAVSDPQKFFDNLSPEFRDALKKEVNRKLQDSNS